MTQSLWQKLDRTARELVPIGSTFFLLLCGAVSLNAGQTQILKPVLPLVAIYYWSLYQPDLIPTFAVFVLGMLYDALVGAPIGVFAAVFITAHATVNTQRRFLIGKSFFIVWLGFALVGVGGVALAWALTSLFYATPLEPARLLFQALVTIILFPLLIWALLRFHIAMLIRA